MPGSALGSALWATDGAPYRRIAELPMKTWPDLKQVYPSCFWFGHASLWYAQTLQIWPLRMPVHWLILK